MNMFDFRNQRIGDYASYIKSFIQIRDPHISSYVQQKLQEGVLWPEPLIQLNPLFARGESIDALVAQGVLHRECARIFRKDKSEDDDTGRPLRLHTHQSEAIHVARTGASYILTTGTGSGKSLAYIIPIVDYVLRNGTGHGIKAIVVYPMNALANSQVKELEKFLRLGYPNKRGPVTFERYTGQESDDDGQRIIAKPEHVIEETLVRTTSNAGQDGQFLQQLDERVGERGQTLPHDYRNFIQDPLPVWIENTFGITEHESRLVRTTPKSISGERGAADALSKLTNQPIERCVEAIQQALLAGYTCEPHPATGTS